jgi:tetratricopeptide (TPR) repeat protein
MKKGLFLTIAAISCCMSFSYAQGTDVESIRQVIATELQANNNRDSTTWFALFNQDSSFSATYVGTSYYVPYTWKQLHDEVSANLKRPLTRKRNVTNLVNAKIKTFGDNGIADLNYRTVDSANKPVRETVETWHFLKNGGSWKISRILAIDTASFNPTKPLSDPALEQEINMAGYRLLAVKKYPEAIKIFKMNIEMFPKAWNTYDSLGEAYMMAGNKKEAISNYEMSIKLNPENTNGKNILKKLKSTK